MVKPDFGDYVYIEQKRYGVENEMYLYKVVGRLHSNAWCDVPVQTPEVAVNHDHSEEVVACICCGVMETTVTRFRLPDVHPASFSARALLDAKREAYEDAAKVADDELARCKANGLAEVALGAKFVRDAIRAKAEGLDVDD